MTPTATDAHDLSCWVLTEGYAGHEGPCLGLAEALGGSIAVKRVVPRRPWTWLPGNLWPAPLASLGPGSDAIAPPWPDVLITCGRRSVPFSLHIRKASGGRTLTVHLQDPRIPLSGFDLIAAPEHDGLTGANVFPTKGALNRITPDLLAREADKIRHRLDGMPRPLVAVLVGGTNSCYRLTEAATRRLAGQLADVARGGAAGLLVTPSRRTGADNARLLREMLDAAPGVAFEMWDFAGDNPYFGYLGIADAVVATCDSVNMISEACTAGKPVHVVALDGGNAKFRRFHEAMERGRHTRPFDGVVESWPPPPLNEAARVARQVEELRRRRGSTPSLPCAGMPNTRMR